MSDVVSERAGPHLLVSVRSAEEAEEALAGGADVIDVKEPRQGVMGRADAATLASVIAAVGRSRRVAISAAMGELAEWEGVEPELSIAGAENITFAKIALAGERRHADLVPRLARIAERFPPNCQLVPVAYADSQEAESPDIESVLELAAQLAAPYLLIDTYRKALGSLDRWQSATQIARLVKRAAAAGIQLAIAGSLDENHLARLAAPLPALVGVRGSACLARNRNGAIDRHRVARLKQALAARAEALATATGTLAEVRLTW